MDGYSAEQAAEIAVTGSRITRPNLEPATSAGVVAAEVLNDLPQLKSTVAAEPPATPAATGGDIVVTDVTTAQWASTRPYMAPLRAAAPADRERVLAEQQKVHGALPAFWFDVAELAWKSGRREEARRLLLSALDLPTRNNETLAIVAERLFRYGEQDRAIEMFEAVAEAEPDRPAAQKPRLGPGEA